MLNMLMIAQMKKVFESAQRVVVRYRDQDGWICNGVLLAIDEHQDTMQVDAMHNSVTLENLISFRTV